MIIIQFLAIFVVEIYGNDVFKQFGLWKQVEDAVSYSITHYSERKTCETREKIN